MKKWLLLLLVVGLSFSGAGCSIIFNRARDRALDELGDVIGDLLDQDGENGASGGETLVTGDFYSFESFFDLALFFKEMEYTYSDDGSSSSVNYTVLGEETINGVKATRIMVEADSLVAEFWVSDEKVLKTILDGEEFEDEMAELMSFTFYGLMAPFLLTAVWEDAFTDLEAMKWIGWQVANQGTTNRNLGAGNVKITTFDIKVAGMDSVLSYEIADIGGRNLFIGWKVTEKDGSTSEFKISRLIPR